MIHDSFNRPLQDVRISVIDRCNFRCRYCMPKAEYPDHYKFLNKEEWLTFDEITRLTRLLVKLGASKIRLTGGEPLLRPGLEQLVRQLSVISEIEDLALTTNGTFLTNQAKALREAGLRRLTVSLDTLDEEVFGRINEGQGTVAEVLEGLAAAEEAGFKRMKINAVVQKGINEESVLGLVKRFKGTGHILRFIEYMDVGNCNHWEDTKVVSSGELKDRIHREFPLEAVDPNYYGEVAARYRFKDGSGELGFVSSVSQPFCGTCTRLRLSADGKLYTCLFAARGTDIRSPMRDGAEDEELTGIIRKVWMKRGDKYSENRALFRSLKEDRKKVEMFQIGG